MKTGSSKRKHHPLLGIVLLALAACLTALNAGAKTKPDIESASPIDVVSDEMLEESKWTNVEDILKLTPGVTIRPYQAGQSSTANVRIRGLGNLSAGAGWTLALVNGQPISDPIDLNTIPANIIQRVEVLKDGASAVYGSDAIAGVVNIIPSGRTDFDGLRYSNSDGASRFSDNPFQAGFHTMAGAGRDPVGQSMFGYYDHGGASGVGAGSMFASSVRLRGAFGGPLCDLGNTSLDWGDGLSQQAGNCLLDEMDQTQSIYDSIRGTTLSPQQKGDYFASGLYGLGFDRDLTGSLVSTRVPGWSGWGTGGVWPAWNVADVSLNPLLRDHILAYRPGGKHAMPVPDGNYMTLEFVFGEQVLVIYVQEAVRPNDPHFKEPDSVAREVGGVLKKGLGALLGASGIGVGTSNEDSQADDQWGLHAVGFTPMGTGASAWDVVDGKEKNVLVAVIDSGLDQSHIDRPRFLWENPGEIPGNGIDDDTNGYVDDIHGWNFVAESNDIDDDYGHGTFVAGIIAANTDNGEGIAGINPGAQVMTLKVCDENGKGDSLAVYRAIRYAVDNGARVINISLGRKGLSHLEQIGINYAYAMGCIVVVAAGNQGGNIANYGPPGSRRSFSVASLNIDGTRRSQSNKGLMVAVAAPGESVYSLTAKNGKRDGRMIPIAAGDYHRLNGTSFAAPFVSGTASLIWARKPHLANWQVEDMILAAAAEAEDPGWDQKTGMGKLDARTALVVEPGKVFAPRITEWIINRDTRGKIVSVDVYGVVRGPVAKYTLAVGRGKNPSQWTTASGPSSRTVNHGHIARLDGRYFQKGSRWSLQLEATALDGQRRVQVVAVEKDG